MIDPAQIPDEVVEAAADALMAMPDGFPPDADPDEYARAAIAAALAAWPGAYDTEDFYAEKHCLILPLRSRTAMTKTMNAEARDD